MNEQTRTEIKPVHYLMIVTTIFYGSLVLFLKLKGNFSTNSLWPFIRIGCKWSLFTWFFYGGIIYGKKLSFALIEATKTKLKNLELDLKEAKSKNNLLETKARKLQKNLDLEIEKTQKIESTLHEKLKKYERTAEDANRDALKNFV